MTPDGSPRGTRSRKLVRCACCGLPASLCLCADLPSLAVRTRVLVVIHANEARKTTNSGRLAARCLAGAEVRLRGAPGDRPVESVPAGRRLLLFPRDDARPLVAGDAGDDLFLVVPDGTWREAGRIARRDAAARGAQAVTVAPAAASSYALRRAPRAGALSTFEAIAHALGILEGASAERALLAVFARFVERHRRVRAGSVHG